MVLVVLMVICVILITERSLLAPLEKEAKGVCRYEAPGEASARRAKNEKKTKTGRRSKRQNRMILPEEVIIKYRVFLCNNATNFQESEVPKETTAKKRKRILQKRSGYAELTVSQESDFSEPLPSPFEDFVINPESTRRRMRAQWILHYGRMNQDNRQKRAT